MAVTMTPMEMLVQEIAQFQEKKTSLQAAIKALEAKLKDVRSDVEMATLKAKADFDKVLDQSATAKAKLEDALAPLKAKVAQLTADAKTAEQRVTDAKNAHGAAVTEQRAEGARLDTAIAAKQKTLDGALVEVAKLKAKLRDL
jgi:chromosome segregation ATPase